MKKKNEPTSDSDIVYIFDEHCFGVVMSPGAHASLVKFIKDGVEYQLILSNEDFTIMEEIGIGYIQEEDL